MDVDPLDFAIPSAFIVLQPTPTHPIFPWSERRCAVNAVAHGFSSRLVLTLDRAPSTPLRRQMHPRDCLARWRGKDQLCAYHQYSYEDTRMEPLVAALLFNATRRRCPSTRRHCSSTRYHPGPSFGLSTITAQILNSPLCVGAHTGTALLSTP
ncbi:hypothetical protein PLICRDRAFT_56584 [Plicaturopsis crispa FD-325 SS-3]|nr:hypothetical protein PLICRDRAFT_56584 [Plicaturopsis crispa FD-325 SS-3]